MKNRTKSSATGSAGLAVIALLTALPMLDAHADPITETAGSGVTAAPGGTVDVAFTFGFGSATPITSFQYELKFDQTALALAGVSVGSTFFSVTSLESGTGQFTPFAPDLVLSNEPGVDLSAGDNPAVYFPPLAPINGAGDAIATWFAGCDATCSTIFPFTVSGSTTLTYEFTVLPGAGAGTSSVSATIDTYSGADTSTQLQGPAGPDTAATVTVTAPVSSVPEPSTASLMLVGLGLVGAGSLLARRRKALES
jgi:hypothetical protein